MKPILILIVLVVFGLSACATTPEPPPAPTTPAPSVTETPLPTIAPTDSPVPLPTNTTASAEPSPPSAPTQTAEPTATAEPKETETVPAAASPTTGTEAAPTIGVDGDIARGITLFATNKCDSCHDISNPFPGGEYGPNLGNISTEALNVIALPEYTGTATNAVEYIRESVLFPNIYIVPGPNYTDSPGVSVMTQDFADTVSEQDLNDLIAYLLSLDAQ